VLAVNSSRSRSRSSSRIGTLFGEAPPLGLGRGLAIICLEEELRALAVDFQVPIWTASQANRDASNSEVVGLENMSEAYGKAMVADFICAISRKPNEKLMGGARLHVAKNRAGRDGFVFPIKIDTSQSRIEVMDEIAEMTLEEVNQGDSSSMKDLLRKKWKEVQESKETV
jgi:hypothetical protein